MNDLVIKPAYDNAVKLIAGATVSIAILVVMWQGKMPGNAAPLSEFLALGSGVLGWVFGVLFVADFAFRKWLWRHKLLRGVLVRFPDLTGVWLAEWESLSFGDTFESVFTIKHDFDHIGLFSERRTGDEKIVSELVGLSCQLIFDDATKETSLFFVYKNITGMEQDRAPGGRDHLACAVVRLVDYRDQSPSALRGDYWTNKPWQPDGSPGNGGTRGKLNMSRKTTLMKDASLGNECYGRHLSQNTRVNDLLSK